VKRILILIALLVPCLFPSFAIAQNNPLKINDKLYGYFVKCRKVNKDPVSLKMADTLFSMAGRLKDKKAQCIAIYIKGSYYFYAKDATNLRKEIDYLGHFSDDTPHTQYYFSLWSQLINYYADNSDYNSALNELGKFQSQAINMPSEFAIGKSYTKYGDIYMLMGNKKTSIEEYEKAVDYYKSINKNDELYDVYERIGNIYSSMDSPLAEKYLQLALETAADIEDSKGSLYVSMLDYYSEHDHDANFQKYFDLLTEWEKSYTLSAQQRKTKSEAMIKHSLMNKQYDKALEYVDTSILTYEIGAKYYYQIYKAKGEYDKALNWDETFNSLESKRIGKMQSDQLAQYAAQYDNDHLRMEKNELALKNASLSIQGLKAKQKLMALEEEHNELELQNTNLELKNRNLELISQQAKTEQQQTEVKREKEKAARMAAEIASKRKNDMFFIAILALVISGAFIFALQKRRSTKQIRQEMKKEATAKLAALAAREEALKANKLKSVFLQNMSHEIRTPLNAIVGFSDILSDPESTISDEDRDQFMELIHSNSDLLTTLINDILDLSKMESGSFTIDLKQNDANRICKDVIASVNGQQASEVRLKLDIPEGKTIIITDEKRLTQLLINLMTNACKYTEKGTITLSCEKVNDDVMFSVTDTGCGIAPENAEKVFNRFEKLDSSRKGTGLGLNICKHIAELLHGKIFLDTSYLGGARFVFIQPMDVNEKMDV
jgi:signal transduction histidine kinase/tetratricopeptide (TPR) repeat protein